MSADFWASTPGCEGCGCEGHQLGDWNLTYNLSPMLKAAGSRAGSRSSETTSHRRRTDAEWSRSSRLSSPNCEPILRSTGR